MCCFLQETTTSGEDAGVLTAKDNKSSISLSCVTLEPNKALLEDEPILPLKYLGDGRLSGLDGVCACGLDHSVHSLYLMNPIYRVSFRTIRISVARRCVCGSNHRVHSLC